MVKKRNNMDFQIVPTGDSFLIGASYYGKNDVAEDDSDDVEEGTK